MISIAHPQTLFYNYGVSWLGCGLRGGIRFLLFLLTAGLASANTLSLGAPTVENDVYSFPVLLQGDNASVAALDFSFAYDPSVFRPAGVHAGVRAEQANKLVSGNMSGPGDFRIVVMGLNQSAMENGEIAWVSLERIGDAAGAELRIDEPAFATPDGEPLSGQGDSLRLPGERPSSEETPSDSDSGDDAVENAPSSPAESEDEVSPGLRQPFSRLPEAMRGTLEDGAEIDGWDALAEDAGASEKIEDAPFVAAETGTAEWVAIPVIRAEAAERDVDRFQTASDREADTLAQVETGPVTIESREQENSLNGVSATTEEHDAAVRGPMGLWIALVIFAVLFSAMLVVIVRRFSA